MSFYLIGTNKYNISVFGAPSKSSCIRFFFTRFCDSQKIDSSKWCDAMRFDSIWFVEVKCLKKSIILLEKEMFYLKNISNSAPFELLHAYFPKWYDIFNLTHYFVFYPALGQIVFSIFFLSKRWKFSEHNEVSFWKIGSQWKQRCELMARTNLKCDLARSVCLTDTGKTWLIDTTSQLSTLTFASNRMNVQCIRN